MNGLKDMKSTFRREKLPLPAVPAHLQGRMEKLRDWAWGTRPESFPLYGMQSYVDEAAEGTADEYFLLGHDGYGTNAWYLHCYVNLASAGIFVQAPWGGAYADSKAALDGVQRRFAVLDRLLQALVRFENSRTEPPGRLIIQQSSMTPPRWAWVVAGQPIEWREEFANAMTPALEFLHQQYGPSFP